MRKITADYIFPISSEPIKNGVIITDNTGKILQIDSRENHDAASLEVYKGVIVPGFINTHCHLELSHMKGMAATGTGLLPFISTVVKERAISQETIDAAIEAADQEMYDGGIVAVGDISNKIDTAATKEKSKIRYYTFVEMFDFLQEDWAAKTYADYYEVYKGQSSGNGNKKSCVPHAPYTVSKNLFKLINEANEDGCTVSLHNQETVHEDNLFLSKTGDFLKFYDAFQISLEAFEANGKTSINYALPHMNPNCRTLLVHNTMSTPQDIQFAHEWGRAGVYWATCANANLYIENRMPYYQHFIDNDAKMTIGTDSLTSNWQLSVLEEMKAISKYQSYLSFETILKWATLNGAEALQMEDDLGSLEVGKSPGLNLLDIGAGLKLTMDTKVKRLL